MEEDQEGDKTEEPSSHRIEQFRKRGEVSQSKELASILILSLSAGFLLIFSTYIIENFMNFFEWFYNLKTEAVYTKKGYELVSKELYKFLFKILGPFFGLMVTISVMSSVSQFGFLFADEALKLKFERLNPINGFKRIMSMQTLMELVKSLLKFALLLGVTYYFFHDRLKQFSAVLFIEPIQGFLYARDNLALLSFLIILALCLVAAVDFAYQKISYQQKLKQTKEQLKRETKEQEGNPEVKQKIRAIQRDMSRRRMAQEVKKADVIVTNPTHYAVALSYKKNEMMAPVVVAKGKEYLALRMRKLAKEYNIPVVENKPLARKLFRTVRVGEFVPKTMYKAIAEVLAFVYKMKNKKINRNP